MSFLNKMEEEKSVNSPIWQNSYIYKVLYLLFKNINILQHPESPGCTLCKMSAFAPDSHRCDFDYLRLVQKFQSSLDAEPLMSDRRNPIYREFSNIFRNSNKPQIAISLFSCMSRIVSGGQKYIPVFYDNPNRRRLAGGMSCC